MAEDGDSKLRVAVIGGGDHASVATIVNSLPERPGITIVVAVPHAHDLAERLRAENKLPVIAVTDSALLEREQIYLLPDEREVSIQDRTLVVEAPNGRGGLDRLSHRRWRHRLPLTSAPVLLRGPATCRLEDGLVAAPTPAAKPHPSREGVCNR